MPHSVIHTKCFSKSGYKNINSKFYCSICCIKTGLIDIILTSKSLTDDDSENFYPQREKKLSMLE